MKYKNLNEIDFQEKLLYTHNTQRCIVLPVEFSRLLAGKNLYNNKLQSYSREFFTLKGINGVLW